MQPSRTTRPANTAPLTGVGLGLRTPHIQPILQQRPDIPWLEILTDNFLDQGGLNQKLLFEIADHYPLSFHGVGLSLGGTDPLNRDYLSWLRGLAAQYRPAWISDHACCTQVRGQPLHDLLPLPYTEEAVKHLSARVQQVQDYLGQQILIENVSRYISFSHSHMDEGEFLAAVAEKADCYLLADLNNAYVNEVNHGDSATRFLQTLPPDRIREVHLAGFETKEDFLLDAHNNPVSEPVWSLYKHLLTMLPDVPTLIEWDNNLPSLEILMQEQRKASLLQSNRKTG